MDTLYMHLNVAWSAMNYSSIAYLAGELQRISTMLYQVRVCQQLLFPSNGLFLYMGKPISHNMLQWVVSAIPVAHAQQDAGASMPNSF